MTISPLEASMNIHLAHVEWQRGSARFTDNRYSRVHAWIFDGGAKIPASSSPHVVRVPLSDPALVDPEEAFVASLASCHMLWFLSIAAQRGWTVDDYSDDALGHMGMDANGREMVAEVVLRPRVRFKRSAESAICCNSSSTNTGINNVPSINPLLQMSAIRPSIITLVSRSL